MRKRRLFYVRRTPWIHSFTKNPMKKMEKPFLEVNLFPDKYCNFNCIFCPVSRKLTHKQTAAPVHLEDVTPAIRDLRQRLHDVQPDLVFINSLGEALLLPELESIIDTIHDAGIPVRLLSNGFLYGNPDYARLASRCEEVIGELKWPMKGPSKKPSDLSRATPFISTSKIWSDSEKPYSGCFHLEITIVKGYSDDPDSPRYFPSSRQIFTARRPSRRHLGGPLR